MTKNERLAVQKRLRTLGLPPAALARRLGYSPTYFRLTFRNDYQLIPAERQRLEHELHFTLPAPAVCA